MDAHKRQVDPRQAGRIGRLIEELRQAAGRLTDDQRDRLAAHLQRQDDYDGQQETAADRRRIEGSDQKVRPHILRSRPSRRRRTIGDPPFYE